MEWKEQRNDIYMIFIVISICLTVSLLNGMTHAYGVDLYTKSDKPFGISLDDWIGKWWTWWFGIPASELPNNMPRSNCLVNISDSMVMLMETTAVVNKANPQECKITSDQGVMIPLWTGYWYDAPEVPSKSFKELSEEARRSSNLGQITSKVIIDGSPISILDVESKIDGVSVYLMENVTEIYAKGFNFTIPDGFGKRFVGQDVYEGQTHRFGAHGWFVFLKSLPVGDHTITYDIGNKGPNNAARVITYLLHVS